MDFTTLLPSSIAQGGLLVAASGALFNLVKDLPSQTFNLVKRKCSVEVTVTNETQAFQHCLDYLLETQKRFRSLAPHETVNRYNECSFSLGFRPEWFFFRQCVVRVQRTQDKTSVSSYAGRPVVAESLTFTFYTHDRDAPLRFVQYLAERANAGEEKRYYYTHDAQAWTSVGKLPYRNIDNIILSPETKSTLLNDIETFYANEAWYEKVGIPYKRGFMLYGPPGTGKTSIIAAIASRFQKHIYALNPAMPHMHDAQLGALLAKVPRDALVVIEDLDSVLDHTSDKQTITLSGLLNAIDGAFSVPGKLLFASTNHLDRIDSALLRPGRFDRIVELGYTTPEQAELYLTRFFGRPISVPRVPRQLTMAQLQEMCLQNRENYAAVQERLSTRRYAELVVEPEEVEA